MSRATKCKRMYREGMNRWYIDFVDSDSDSDLLGWIWIQPRDVTSIWNGMERDVDVDAVLLISILDPARA